MLTPPASLRLVRGVAGAERRTRRRLPARRRAFRLDIWFEQVNVLGELRTVDAIAAEHLALEGEDVR